MLLGQRHLCTPAVPCNSSCSCGGRGRSCRRWCLPQLNTLCSSTDFRPAELSTFAVLRSTLLMRDRPRKSHKATMHRVSLPASAGPGVSGSRNSTVTLLVFIAIARSAASITEDQS